MSPEKNLRILEAFRGKLDDGFERLPFGVVESMLLKERREVMIHRRVSLDSDGVQHLSDEREAVEDGVGKPEDEETPERRAKHSAVYGQSGPILRIGGLSPGALRRG